MKNVILSSLVFGLLTLVFLVGFFWWQGRITAPPSEPEAAAKPALTETGEVPRGYFDLREENPVLITFEGYDIQPRRVFVRSGTEMIWKNMDRVSHQVKSELINSPVLKKDELFTITLKEPGVYDYRDSFNPDIIKGTIVVTDK